MRVGEAFPDYYFKNGKEKLRLVAFFKRFWVRLRLIRGCLTLPEDFNFHSARGSLYPSNRF
jgi:hypothetical protein